MLPERSRTRMANRPDQSPFQGPVLFITAIKPGWCSCSFPRLDQRDPGSHAHDALELPHGPGPSRHMVEGVERKDAVDKVI